MFLTQTPAKPLKFLQELHSQQLFRSSNMIEKNQSWCFMSSLPPSQNNSVYGNLTIQIQQFRVTLTALMDNSSATITRRKLLRLQLKLSVFPVIGYNFFPTLQSSLVCTTFANFYGKELISHWEFVQPLAH